MSKLPAFQFYPGDWMKDPNLRRCSAAARGIWMDLLCLMFECADRGRLVTNSVTWTLQDAAQAISGDTKENLSLIQELLDKGVAHQDENGVIYSKRLLRDENKRVGNKERQHDFRESQKSNACVTHHVTPMSEEEVEDEKEDVVGVKKQLLDSAVEEIWQLYPRKVSKKQGISAIRAAIDREAKALELPGAIDYLKIQTEKFFKAVSPYIQDDFMLGKCPHGATWFNDSRYDLPPAEWTANFKTNYGPKALGGANGGTRASQRQNSSFDAIRAAVDRANERATGGGNGSHEGSLHQPGSAGGDAGRDDAGLESPDSGIRRKDIQASVIESTPTLQILPNHGRDKGILRSGIERIPAPVGSG